MQQRPKVIRLPDRQDPKLFEAQFRHLQKLHADKELKAAYCIYEVPESCYFYTNGTGDLIRLLGTLLYVILGIHADQYDSEDVVLDD